MSVVRLRCVARSRHGVGFRARARSIAHSTVGDDENALVWDLNDQFRRLGAGLELEFDYSEHSFAYSPNAPINAVSWSVLQPEWIALSHDATVEVLHI